MSQSSFFTLRLSLLFIKGGILLFWPSHLPLQSKTLKRSKLHKQRHTNGEPQPPGQTEPLPAHILSELRVVYIIGHLGLFKPSAVWIILPRNPSPNFSFPVEPNMPKRKTADDTADKAAEAFPPSIVEACNGTFLRSFWGKDTPCA